MRQSNCTITMKHCISHTKRKKQSIATKKHCMHVTLPPDPNPLVLQHGAPITQNPARTCPPLLNWKARHSAKLLKKLFVASATQTFTWNPARAVSSKLLLVFTLQLRAQKSIRTFLANFHVLSATGPEKVRACQ